MSIVFCISDHMGTSFCLGWVQRGKKGCGYAEREERITHNSPSFLLGSVNNSNNSCYFEKRETKKKKKETTENVTLPLDSAVWPLVFGTFLLAGEFYI